ncbi:MAG: hypothetical protein ACPGVD_06615, partial [Flavobacteriales bacterium]
MKMLYTKYFNKLELLWSELYFGNLKNEKAKNKFFKLRKSDWEKIQEFDSKLDIKRVKVLMKKTEEETNKYLNKYHNYE